MTHHAESAPHSRPNVPLYSTQEVYRPVFEEKSALLEVQVGCSWRRCKFCDFPHDGYRVFTLEEIDAKARQLAPLAQGSRRIFLLGANAFHRPARELLQIFQIVYKYMPWIEEISMYARYTDVLEKTDQELQLLHECGLAELHIGMESGYQKLLDYMDKGVRVEDAKLACRRLREAGIAYTFTMICGLGGQNMSVEHAYHSALFLNDTQPKRLWILGLLLWPNTPLATLVEKGEFRQLTLKQRLEELGRMVDMLELNDCHFVDSTVLNKYTLQAHLPEELPQLRGAIQALLAQA
jgi:radical SAM superfamily enzyme YgiQ (UPF0313 family)